MQVTVGSDTEDVTLELTEDQYLLATDRTMADPDSPGDKWHGPLMIKPSVDCDHGNTLCNECAHTWAWDYELDYDSTPGGRVLRDNMRPDPSA